MYEYNENGRGGKKTRKEGRFSRGSGYNECDRVGGRKSEVGIGVWSGASKLPRGVVMMILYQN